METNTMHKCEVCGQTGNTGAMWLVVVKGDNKPPKRVHRPCGLTVLKHIPEGITAKVEPSEELRAEWRAKREQEHSRKFWDTALAKVTTVV